jgi:hypothetical protein
LTATVRAGSTNAGHFHTLNLPLSCVFVKLDALVDGHFHFQMEDDVF